MISYSNDYRSVRSVLAHNQSSGKDYGGDCRNDSNVGIVVTNGIRKGNSFFENMVNGPVCSILHRRQAAVSERLRVGDRIFSPRYGEGVIVDTEFAVTTRPWIHKTKVIVAWDDGPVTRGYRGDSDAIVHEHCMYEKRTVERYRENFTARQGGGGVG